MLLDPLLQALPQSGWITLLLAIAVVYLAAERVFKFSLTVADRRSDKQLLEQAEKATAILEKLPDDHQSRTDLLSYVSSGPINELNKRQQDRAKRQEEAPKRKDRIFNWTFSAIIAAVLYVPFTPSLFSDLAEIWNAESVSIVHKIWAITIGVCLIALLYIVLLLVVFGFSVVTGKAGDRLERWADKARAKRIRKKQGELLAAGTDDK